jgi:hypothetical protein
MSNWKDKRINAINKVVKNKYDHQYYIEEYCNIINSKSNNKREYKQKKIIPSLYSSESEI